MQLLCMWHVIWHHVDANYDARNCFLAQVSGVILARPVQSSNFFCSALSKLAGAIAPAYDRGHANELLVTCDFLAMIHD